MARARHGDRVRQTVNRLACHSSKTLSEGVQLFCLTADQFVGRPSRRCMRAPSTLATQCKDIGACNLGHERIHLQCPFRGAITAIATFSYKQFCPQ
jgi:hypothetical protein